MILIGSRALSLRVPQALLRAPLDFDFLCTQEEFDQWMKTTSYKVNPTKVYPLPEYNKMIVEGSTNCEFEIITPGNSSELIAQAVANDTDNIETPFGIVPSLDLLFTIKDSHKYKKFEKSSSQFWKTTIDWHVMRQLGGKVRPEYEALLKLRKEETYTYKHPKLNVNKDAFFSGDGVIYTYDHDDLHNVVKLYDKPAYTYYLKDGEQILCDKEKFFSVSEDIRLAGGLEEMLTLSLERAKIPYPNGMTDDQAFKFAAAKVCSTITSGFFRTYCHENIFNIIKLYEKTSKDYVLKFNTAVQEGQVKLYNPIIG